MRDHTQWKEDTIRDALHEETKDAKKQENGRSSSDARKAKALVKVKRWIYGNHVIYGKYNGFLYLSRRQLQNWSKFKISYHNCGTSTKISLLSSYIR
jgi:hypothetical protein